MAKRKKKKETKKGFAHATELYGVLLVLAAILGSFSSNTWYW